MIDVVLLALLVVGVLTALRDPRRLLPGVLITLGTMALISTIVRIVFDAGALLAGFDDDVRTLIEGLFVLLFPVLLGFGLGLFLVLNGITMIRREQRSIANLLSLVLGAGILGLFALGGIAIFLENVQLVAVMVMFMPPVAYLGTGFFAYLCWSKVYAGIARRVRNPQAVIVLGSGIRKDGSVTPLLAKRVALGVQLLKEWPSAVGVMSGGQGADEPRSEGDAMTDYAIQLGVPDTQLLTERASRNTEENLLFSRQILDAQGLGGSTLTVTSSYHAFRAATLMRRLRIAGHARGASTAAYYLPSALLREYLALLRDHKRMNVIVLGVSLLPGITFLVGLAVSALTT